MDQSELFSRLGVSLAIGLLVGLERGWSQRSQEDHRRAAGFRTFALSGLLGGVAALVSLTTGGVVLGIALVTYAIVFAAFHWLEATSDKDVSVTSVVAGLLTFLLGAQAVLGDIGIAVAGAVAMTALLAFREPLHRWVSTLTWAEVRSILILLAMTFLLLPILPRQTIDPWGAINPYEVWLLTVLVAAVSFVGYIATKLLGDRFGILLAAAAGGLASSTATTLALSRMSREHPESVRLLSAGILLAGAVMMARVVGVTLLLNAQLARQIALPILVAGAVLGVCTLGLAVGGRGPLRPLSATDNPLGVRSALQMGALMIAVMLAVGYARSTFGSSAVHLVAAVSGVLDTDALTISMARLGGSEMDGRTAAQAILIGVAANTTTKAVMAISLGSKWVGLTVSAANLMAVVAGLTVALSSW